MRKDAAARREKLIEVAAMVFERDGYDIPLEAIVATAGVGRGTLYRNFPDRAALMAAVLVYKLDELEQFVAAHEDDATLLKAFVRKCGLNALLHAPAIECVRAGSSEGALKHSVEAMTARADVLIDEIVARCQAAGTLCSGADREHLRMVNRMLAMAACEPSETQDETLNIAVEIVINGLSPR